MAWLFAFGSIAIGVGPILLFDRIPTRPGYRAAGVIGAVLTVGGLALYLIGSFFLT